MRAVFCTFRKELSLGCPSLAGIDQRVATCNYRTKSFPGPLLPGLVARMRPVNPV